MNVLKRLSIVFLSCVLTFCLTGCGGSSTKDGPVKNSEFISDLKDALIARWDYTEKELGDSITHATKIEEKALADYKKATYKDKDFAKLAKLYIADLKTMRETYKAEDAYDDESDYQKAYKDRCRLLYVFSEDYKLSFKGDDYEDIFDELLDTGKSVVNTAAKNKKKEAQVKELQTIFDGAQWQQVREDDYTDDMMWVTTLTNSTSFKIKEVDYDYEFYDAGGVKLDSDERYESIKGIEKGASFQIKIDSYSVPDGAAKVKLLVQSDEYSTFEVE